MRRWLLAPLCTFALGCSDDKERAAEFVKPPVVDAKSCGHVRQALPEKGQVLVDGKPANCEPDGLACALFDVPAYDGVCQPAEQPEAKCERGLWVLTCVEAADSGTTADAAADSGSTADAATDSSLPDSGAATDSSLPDSGAATDSGLADTGSVVEAGGDG